MPGVIDDGFFGGVEVSGLDCSDGTPCFIVQGSNQNGPISVISTSTSNYPSDLSSVAGNTGTPDDGNIFQHFPGRFSEYEIRNPFDVWDAEYN